MCTCDFRRNAPILHTFLLSGLSCLHWGHSGRFRTARAQRGHSANYYAVYPGNTPEVHPPTDACVIHSKQHRGCGIQDPGARGYRRWKTADFSHSARCAPIYPAAWQFTGLHLLFNFASSFAGCWCAVCSSLAKLAQRVCSIAVAEGDFPGSLHTSACPMIPPPTRPKPQRPHRVPPGVAGTAEAP